MGLARPSGAWHVHGVNEYINPVRPGLIDWCLLAVLVILWGSAYAGTHIGVGALPPAVLVACRLWIGASVLGIGCFWVRATLPSISDKKTWGRLALIGGTGTLLPFLLISTAQKTVPSALAAIYIAAAPLTVALLCHFLVKSERLNWARALGVALGFGGVCLLFAPALMDHGIGATPLIPQVLLLIAAVLYGATSVMMRLVSPNLHPVAMSFGFVLIAAILSLPFAVAAWPSQGVQVQPYQMGAILALGALSTGLANLLYVLSIRRVGAVFMSNVGNLAPFWSIGIGAIAFGEVLPPTTFAALAILLFGVYLVQRVKKA
ncbi:hypothetical conserved integral membrane protein [Candidatus Phycosocius spiralis]|uniref:Hypothetical conserved integral membrane protein n=1 Tax=Candidatus Phycosocius spiralis TaxID=2815099 RepID=A0ABQ4PTI4_9PROT|nr:hypothetical conserved integral membrane protein [Candidatus Phycosocius spiralis]